MKKYGIWFLILIAIVVIGAVIYWFTTKNNKPATPSNNTEKLSTQIDINENISNIEIPNATNTETELAKFSTKILVEDDNRDHNLELTASKINNVVVKSKEEFSFNKTVGNPTPDRGYEKAGIFVNGKKAKGYGGGNCQISTTLYDAVLKIKELKVTERHEHGKEVGYVEMGKDATVTYDELDLKFKNNADFDIKIYCDVTKDHVNVRIVKLNAQ